MGVKLDLEVVDLASGLEYCINIQYLSCSNAMSAPSFIEDAGPLGLASPCATEEGLAPTAPEAAGLHPAGRPGRIPAELNERLWRAHELSSWRQAGVSTGFAALDAELPDGGWPCASLTELLLPQPSLLEWRLLGPCLRHLVGARAVVVIGPPKQPHLPGLRHLGLEDDGLIWIRAETPSERLWATEQLVRANAAAAVLTWLPQARPEQLRRLQVLAQACEGPVFVFRPVAARHEPSPAPLRLLAAPMIDWALQVQILKRRGPVHEGSLTLPSIPGGLHHVLTARTLRPSQLIPSKEVRRHAVGRPAPREHRPIAAPALDRSLHPVGPG